MVATGDRNAHTAKVLPMRVDHLSLGLVIFLHVISALM
jgi:hypothetical protein